MQRLAGGCVRRQHTNSQAVAEHAQSTFAGALREQSHSPLLGEANCGVEQTDGRVVGLDPRHEPGWVEVGEGQQQVRRVALEVVGTIGTQGI
jgi:hypothetical protein